MVTNINLAAPDTEKKSPLTGKSALSLAILLVIVVFGAYGVILYFKNSYSKQNQEIEKAIGEEKNKMAGENYANLYDFQERLILLDGVIGDHPKWDVFLKDFSRYLIPEVYLTSLAYDEKEGNLDIQGFASGFEALSREMILLKSYPGAGSVEFKKSSERAASENSQGGVEFEIGIKVNDSVFK